MAGILVQLILSWLLVWLIARADLSVLGMQPSRKRLFYFAVFFLLATLCCSSGFLLRMFFGGEQWTLNPQLTPAMFFDGLWWNIKSVLFEELIFRGVILYILIKRFGAERAIILSAVGFGIYHWFSQELFGNPVQMVVVFVMTGVMGLLLAYGYRKTYSLYVPIAIHLGWNFTQIFVFSSGPNGDGMFVLAAPAPEITVSYLVYAIVTWLPVLSVWTFSYILIRRIPQSPLP